MIIIILSQEVGFENCFYNNRSFISLKKTPKQNEQIPASSPDLNKLIPI